MSKHLLTCISFTSFTPTIVYCINNINALMAHEFYFSPKAMMNGFPLNKRFILHSLHCKQTMLNKHKRNMPVTYSYVNTRKRLSQKSICLGTWVISLTPEIWKWLWCWSSLTPEICKDETVSTSLHSSILHKHKEGDISFLVERKLSQTTAGNLKLLHRYLHQQFHHKIKKIKSKTIHTMKHKMPQWIQRHLKQSKVNVVTHLYSIVYTPPNLYDTLSKHLPQLSERD